MGRGRSGRRGSNSPQITQTTATDESFGGFDSFEAFMMAVLADDTTGQSDQAPTVTIPPALQFTTREQTLLDEIAEYRRLEQTGRGYTMGERQPEIEELQGQNGRLQIPMAEARITALERTARQAADMIAQRRAEGYQGQTRSYAQYRSLMNDLRTATDDERSDILSAASVGADGIRYWQLQRTKAERQIERLKFAIKLQRRYEAGIES